jgi:hypothetical protein
MKTQQTTADWSLVMLSVTILAGLATLIAVAAAV